MKSGRTWLFWIILFAGIILGELLGELAANVDALSWLAFGDTFGLTEPLVLDLGVLVLTFGLTIKLNVASILGIVLACITYRFVK